MAGEDKADERLVVFEEDVVFGPVALDQVVFENEGVFSVRATIVSIAST